MGDRGLYLLHVTIRPGASIKDVIDGLWNNLKASLNDGESKVVYGFKVVGENCLVILLEGCIETAISSLNVAFGHQIDIKCTPLRTYEGFARNVLGVDDEALTKPSEHKLGSDGRIFLLHFVVEYRGMTASELLGTWKREAEKALGLRCSGDLELDLFKVVAQREVYGFIKAPDGEIMDDISFTLPMLKELGDQVHITTKVLLRMPVN